MDTSTQNVLAQSFLNFNIHAIPWDTLKGQAVTQQVRGGTRDSAFIASSQMMGCCWPGNHTLPSKGVDQIHSLAIKRRIHDHSNLSNQG